MTDILDTQHTKGKIGMFHSALRMEKECMKPSEKKLSVVSEFSCHSQSHSPLALSCPKAMCPCGQRMLVVSRAALDKILPVGQGR